MRWFVGCLGVGLLYGGMIHAQERTKPLNPRIDSLFPAYPVSYLTDMAAMVADPVPVNDRLGYVRDSLKLSLVVVTLETTKEFDPADVAREIGRRWMVAMANDTVGATTKNTGGVILLVKDSRQCRIETATGSEGYITDGVAGQLCRDARDDFRQGKFGPGLLYIVNEFASRHVAAMTPTIASTVNKDSDMLLWFFGIGFFLIGVGYWIWRLITKKIEEEDERERQLVMERNRREEAQRAQAEARRREEIRRIELQETTRRNALTPEQRESEDAARRKRLQEDEDRRRARIAEDQRRDEERRRTSTSYDSGFSSNSGGYSSGGSSGGSDSSSIGGGSDSFSGGGGGADW